MNETNWLRARLSDRLTLGWKTRHLVVLLSAGLGVYLFMESRAEWIEMHRWNRAVGDMSLVLVALSMAIGPLARLSAVFRTAIPWRRRGYSFPAPLWLRLPSSS